MYHASKLNFLAKRAFQRADLAKENLRFELLEPRLCLSVFTLHSNPDANHTIYLDFDGHITEGTTWNSNYGVSTIVSPPYDIDGDSSTFNSTELTRIQNVWDIVAEDFIPFDVDVTTEDPGSDALRYSGGGDTQWGVRVVITDDTFANCGCGGHAFPGSFDDSTDEPVFVYNTSQTGVSEASSHEVGHSVLLSHDGTPQVTYYSGHGSGVTSWGTLMGASYNRNVTQWSQGEYSDANNTGSGANYGNGPDDLSVIASLTNGNGFGFRADDHGDTSGAATVLGMAGQTVTGSGIVERTTDIDVFSFVTGAGNIQLDIDTVQLGPNLDIRAELRDSNDTLVAVSDPASVLDASFNVSVPAGQYTLQVTGTGTGNPLNSSPTGYTEYGSLGRYFISGTVVDSNAVVISLEATDDSAAELGQDPGTFAFTRTGQMSGNVTVFYTLGGTADNGTDFNALSGSVTILDSQSTATVTVIPIDDGTSEGNENIVLTIAPDASYLIGSPSADTVTIIDDDLTDIDDLANSDNLIDGTITSGSFLDTHSDNDVYEVIQEESYAGNKRSRMQTRWTINVTRGNSVTFFVEAHHDSSTEHFDFEYSTDGSSWTYMLTVTNNSDNDLPQTYDLPAALSGNVFIRAIDTDRSRNENTLDSLYVDEMFTRSSLGGNQLPQVSIAASDSSAAEQGLDPGEFTVSRSGNLIGDLVVNYAIGGNADNGVDYGALSGSVTIADGNATATIPINPSDDIAAEGSETVILTLQSDAAYTVTNPNSDTVTIADDDVVSSDDYAISQSNTYGTVSGALADTLSSNNQYQSITEESFAGNKRSRLLHQWTFDVNGGNTVTFVVEAHHTGGVDDFDFEYSTDGSSWTQMLTVTKTSDNDTAQNFVLPNSTNGTVFVRVVDTDRNKEAGLDTIFVDEMYISSDNSGAPIEPEIEVDHQDPKWMFEGGNHDHGRDHTAAHGQGLSSIGDGLHRYQHWAVDYRLLSSAELDRYVPGGIESTTIAFSYFEQMTVTNEGTDKSHLPLSSALDTRWSFARRIQPVDAISGDRAIDDDADADAVPDEDSLGLSSANLDQLFAELENLELEF